MIDLVTKSVINSSIGFEITVRNTSPSRLLDLVSKIFVMISVDCYSYLECAGTTNHRSTAIYKAYFLLDGDGSDIQIYCVCVPVHFTCN